ncbi:NAD(P)/FAD-dependent oxidoreductase [Anaerotruncus colihominis]|uniref:NAD(P)/FAD-dependent oxidoreductase n=1 Tax=Anaerotruncus colihominis TaxID=169435 RepID=UPI0011DD87B5|nr:NAD(P)/FAD-dependent oxidoreductase [Anaerotruncus colihominis]
MKTIAILGFGCAGYHCAKTLRELGYEGAIHVFSDTDLPPYNPMLTTYYAGHRLPWKGLFPFGSLSDIARSLWLTVHTGAAAIHLDTPGKTLYLADGSVHTFDALLISTGARVFLPPLPALPEKNVYVMRTPADAEALRRRLDQGNVKQAVVVGASMVGIKVAELFQRAGARCILADMAPSLFPLAAVPEVGAELGQRVMEKGVQLKFGVGLTAIDEVPDGLKVSFGTETLDADVVVLAIGTRANLDFLDGSEPQVNRGILVNEKMETSAPGIYAAGDCASGRNIQTGQNQIIGLWANAGYQGRTAAGAMLGKPVDYPGNMPHNITHFMDMDFIGFGNVRAKGEIIRCRRDGFFLYAIRQEGTLALVNIVDNHIISGVIKNYMTRKFLGSSEPISSMQKVILLRSGLDEAIIELLERSPLNEGVTYE